MLERYHYLGCAVPFGANLRYWVRNREREEATVYAVLPGRGCTAAAAVLGADYGGWLLHDGLRCYYRFEKALHPSCLAHLLRRCREMAQVASGGAARFPLQVQTLVENEPGNHGARSADGDRTTGSAMGAVAGEPYRCRSHVRLAHHLRHEQPYLFTFLKCPGLDATHNAGERALRGIVIARKVWGGNRTWNGARVQQIRGSVLRTCRQQGKDAFGRLVGLLRCPAPHILDIVPTSSSP